jgi:RHS repeat-associated protein
VSARHRDNYRRLRGWRPKFPEDFAATSREESIGFGGQNGYFTDSDTAAGLICFGHRYYDSSTGRFINRDPIGYEGGENLYAFCGGDPVNGDDPGGTDFTVGSKADPIFVFGGADVRSGLVVGLSAVGSSASFGIWNGGSARYDPTYKTSKVFADVGVTAASFAVPVGSLSAGARTVFYSGDGALEAARAGKGAGMLLEDTVGGRILNAVDRALLRQGRAVPRGVWRAASALYALNAKGKVVTAFVMNSKLGSIYMTVERPILYFRNFWIIVK